MFCQHNDTSTVITTENGRRKIIQAAEKRRDKIYTRLLSIEEDFVYHVTNKCYKGYTLKKNFRIYFRVEFTYRNSGFYT